VKRPVSESVAGAAPSPPSPAAPVVLLLVPSAVVVPVSVPVPPTPVAVVLLLVLPIPPTLVTGRAPVVVAPLVVDVDVPLVTGLPELVPWGSGSPQAASANAPANEIVSNM